MFAPRINYIAIVTCVVFQFIFGMLWYSPWVFGDLWLSLAGMSMEQFEALGIAPYVFSIIASFISTYVLAWLIIATHSVGTSSAVKIAFIAWAGFVVPIVWASNAFRGITWELSALELAAQGVDFLVTGAVLGSWKRRS